MSIHFGRHIALRIGLGVLALGLLTSMVPASAQMGRRVAGRSDSRISLHRDRGRLSPVVVRHRTRHFRRSARGRTLVFRPRKIVVRPRHRSRIVVIRPRHRRHARLFLHPRRVVRHRRRGLHRGFVLGRRNPHRIVRARGAYGFYRHRG